jgi:hypothetical protein
LAFDDFNSHTSLFTAMSEDEKADVTELLKLF